MLLAVVCMKRLLFVFAIGVCISACGSKSSPSPSTPSAPSTPAPVTPTLQSVTLSGSAAAMRAKGETSQTTATGTLSNGASQNVTSTCVNWQSDNVSVLTINSAGLVTAQGSGSSTITTTCQSVFARGLVTLALGPRTTFGAGQYLVGSDIASGRYYADPLSGCYWERQSGLGGTLAEVLANEFIGFNAGQWIVDILSGDKAFKTDSDCGTWFQSQRRGLQATITPGMWEVGSQINPGTYRATVSSGCYWERMRNFQGTLGGIIANDFVGSAGQQLVEIRASDAGFQSDDDCGTWTRVTSLAFPFHEVTPPQSDSAIESNRARQRGPNGIRQK